MKRIFLYISVVLGITLSACNLEKEIEIDLPDYENRFVVECYLEPGQPFRLLLSKSSSYFSPLDTKIEDYLTNLLVQDATITIKQGDKTWNLQAGFFFDPITNKLYNYGNDATVPAVLGTDFSLEIKTPDGSVITSKTRLLPVVPIDSLVIGANEKGTDYRILTYATDQTGVANFYRRVLHKSTLDSIPLQSFTVDDELLDTPTFVFGSGYEFKKQDTIINTLYHIDRAYFDFLNSVEIAAQSNGNPFGSPSPISSNVKSTGKPVMGIFTGLSYDRRTTIIEP